MTDVRSLLKAERTARQISHPYAVYSPSGVLSCSICHLQLKSESLWAGHIKSPQHIARLQKSQAAKSILQDRSAEEVRSKKRKVDSDEDGDHDGNRKRSRADGLPDGFFDDGEEAESPPSESLPIVTGIETQLPSRPATPHKPLQATPPIPPTAEAAPPPPVDEDEWAAFEADIAAASVSTPTNADAVISAPAMSNADLLAKNREEENEGRKNREAAELEGDKEDAARALEVEFEEMRELDDRIKRLKEKREALRIRGEGKVKDMEEGNDQANGGLSNGEKGKGRDDEDDDDGNDNGDDDDDDDDDDWDGFRLR